MITIALLALQVSGPVPFVRDGRLQVIGSAYGGRERHVREPVVSPDGKRIAFWREGGEMGRDQLVELNLATRRSRVLATANLRTPAYSRDGGTLFFTIGAPWEIYAVSPGGKPRKVFGHAQGARDLFSPNWSHGNAALTIQDMTWVYWVRPNGTVERKVAIDQILDKDAGVTSASSFADRPGQPTLLVFDSEVGYEQPLPRSWEGPGSSIFLYDTVTKERRSLLPERVFADQPRWTKDGKSIVFRRIDAAGAESIWSVRMDGSGLRQLAANGREPGT